jgi:hypothetical protein
MIPSSNGKRDFLKARPFHFLSILGGKWERIGINHINGTRKGEGDF